MGTLHIKLQEFGTVKMVGTDIACVDTITKQGLEFVRTGKSTQARACKYERTCPSQTERVRALILGFPGYL